MLQRKKRIKKQKTKKLLFVKKTAIALQIG